MKDTIRWINHAGYELQTDGLRIVHDPWLDGFAFQGAWSLVAGSNYGYDEFTGVDYLWISHEHPDHFAPAVLRKIPADARRNITVLHQHTRDKRVISFCRKLGIAAQELPDRQTITLKNGVKITCGVVGQDSWSLIETSNGNYFNANDCVNTNWADLAHSLRRRVNILLTQFSYASWVGNPGDDARMAMQANEKISQMEQQLAAFQPEILIPFASYVWFCRPENFHLNSQVNKIDKIYALFKDRLRTVVLYPGDIYHPGEAFDSADAVNRYMIDLAAHHAPLPTDDKSSSMEDLNRLADAHQNDLRRKNAMWMLRPLAWTTYVRPVRLYLQDIAQGIEYSMFGGILRRGLARDECDLELRSSSFANMLINGYGYATFYIGGRFTELKPGGCTQLSKHFAISGQNEAGYTFPKLLLRKNYLLAHLTGLFTKHLGLKS
jgi:UDP-MurNAc hydroxylase